MNGEATQGDTFPGNGQRRFLARSSDAKLSLDDAKIGILAALPHEYAAIRGVLGCSATAVAHRNGDDKDYLLGVVPGKQEGWGLVVAVAMLRDMGNVSAAARVTAMISDCKNIEEVLVCGIAGAVPAPNSPIDHVRLGDIVVSSDGVVQYDFGKQYENDFEITGHTYLPSVLLSNAARRLRADEAVGQRPWERYIESFAQVSPAYQRPDDSTDILREAILDRRWPMVERIRRAVLGWIGLKAEHPVIPHPHDTSRTPNQPRIFYGLIASASRVLKDQRLRESLRKKFKAKAIEMEAAGAAHAARDAKVGYFAIRGTCDYCNDDKNKVWQNYAALTAAAYTKALLEEIDLNVFNTPQKKVTVVSTASAGFDDVSSDPNSLALESALARKKDEARGVIDELVVEGLPTSGLSSVTVRDVPRSASDMGVEPSAQDTLTAAFVQVPHAMARVPGRPNARLLPDAETPSATQEHSREQLVLRPSDRELALIIAEGEAKIVNLEDLLLRWEFVDAFTAATRLAEWINEHESYVPAGQVSRSYALLARAEAVRARRNSERGPTDLTLSRYYLGKAKDAADK